MPILFTFIFDWKQPLLNASSFIIECIRSWELFKEPPRLLLATLMLGLLFECLIEFVRGVPRVDCVLSSAPSRGPSEYDGGHLVHTVLAKQEKLLRIKGIFVSGIVSHLA